MFSKEHRTIKIDYKKTVGNTVHDLKVEYSGLTAFVPGCIENLIHTIQKQITEETSAIQKELSEDRT